MITQNQYTSNGKFMAAVTLYGLSTDTKPTSYGNGSCFVEMDTSNIYFYDAVSGDWLEWGSVDQSDAQGGDS